MEAMATHGMALLLMIVSTTMSTIALARHGSEEQKRRYLPGLARGTTRFCFAITEPNAGSNSFRLETLAARDGDGYRIRGQKYFISGVEQAQHVLLVTRTTPARDVTDKRAGLSLFIVDTDAPGFTKQVQDTALNETERQWTLFLDDVHVPRSALIGEEGLGHRYLFDLLNPERVVSAAIASGLGRYVLGRAVAYARERKVFGTPIGAHQGLAHPMALAATHLELASLMMRKGRVALRPRPVGRRGGEHGEDGRRRRRPRGVRRGDPGPRRQRVHARVRGRELTGRCYRLHQDGAGVAGDDPELTWASTSGVAARAISVDIMGINVRLETEYGEVLGEVLDPQNLLPALLPSWDDEHFTCLRFVDPYGDTVFQRSPDADLCSASCVPSRRDASTPEQETLLNAVEDCGGRHKPKPNRYLKFIED
jgi:alkylation response protein AidB-like acyl-CoA dehydrogenase